MRTGNAEGPGAERRGAPPGPGLPCLFSNNSNSVLAVGGGTEVSQDRPDARLLLRLNLLTGGHKRSAHVLYEEVKAFVARFGIEHCGFFTLTHSESVTVKESNRRFNSLRSGVLADRYERAIVVLERQKSGRPHNHLLVAVKADIRTGCDFEAFKRRDYSSAAPALRAEWAFWRETCPKYGFGRHELLPVKSNQEGIARYVGKYISKHVRERLLEDKVARLVRYLGFKPGERTAHTRFAWNSDGAWLWRQKVGAFAREYGLRDLDEISRVCGKRWAWFLQERILEQELHGVVYPSYACACRDHPEMKGGG